MTICQFCHTGFLVPTPSGDYTCTNCGVSLPKSANPYPVRDGDGVLQAYRLDSPNYSTADSASHISPSLDYDTLMKAVEMLKDPLEQRGIKKDWLCVIHPRLVQPTREAAKGLGVADWDVCDLSRITGRTTRVMNSAPETEIQYMSVVEFVKRYGEEVLALARLQREMREREPNEHTGAEPEPPTGQTEAGG